MDENKKRLIAWVKAHRTQLLLAGISVVAFIGAVLCVKNREKLVELLEALENSIKNPPTKNAATVPVPQMTKSVTEVVQLPRSYTSPQIPFDVSQHIRTMSDRKHHSAQKAAEAEALGISLLPNQTLVDTYTKCAV